MKLKKTVVTIAVASGAALAAGAALAQSAEQKFKQLDKNKDGFLTQDEVSSMENYTKAFHEADDNKDGKLDSDEFIKSESIYARQNLGAYVGDSALTTKVKTALLMEKELKSTSVHVETTKGVVRLSGQVENEAQRKMAYTAALKVEGVKAVKDDLKVK